MRRSPYTYLNLDTRNHLIYYTIKRTLGLLLQHQVLPPPLVQHYREINRIYLVVFIYISSRITKWRRGLPEE